MSTQYVCYKVNMPLICTLTSSFQPLLPESRPMTSCHVTMVMDLFIIQIKRKMFKSKCTITGWDIGIGNPRLPNCKVS